MSRKELAAKLHADGESPFAPSRTPPPHPTEPVLTSALIAALTTALITMLTSTLTTTLSVVSPPWCSLWRPPLLIPTGELEALLGLPDARTIPKVVRLMRYLEQTGA